MTNKWQITLDVTEEDMTLLVGLLVLAEREKPGASSHVTYLKTKIELAWLERNEAARAFVGSLRTARFGPPWRRIR